MNLRNDVFLRLPFVLIAFGIALPSLKSQESAPAIAAGTEPAKMLIGAWQLKTANKPGSPSGIGSRLKLFTGTHFCVVQPDPKTGKIVFQHGGHYTFDGSVLTETIDFAGESTSYLIGKTFKLKIKITDETLEQLDEAGVRNEAWERAKVPEKK